MTTTTLAPKKYFGKVMLNLEHHICSIQLDSQKVFWKIKFCCDHHVSSQTQKSLLENSLKSLNVEFSGSFWELTWIFQISWRFCDDHHVSSQKFFWKGNRKNITQTQSSFKKSSRKLKEVFWKIKFCDEHHFRSQKCSWKGNRILYNQSLLEN